MTEVTFIPQVALVAGAGIGVGLWLLARGFAGYRTATRIGDTGTSPIGTMAAGEVRVSGVIEAAEALLISPLQSVECVYYRATIRDDDDLGDLDADFVEERAIGFRLRDPSGAVRIFPRAARWDPIVAIDESTGSFGESPAGLRVRTGDTVAVGEPDRAALVERLLTVRPLGDAGAIGPLSSGSGGRRRFREARLAPGDEITIVGRAMPFSDLSDPTEADMAIGGAVGLDDPEVAADIAAARAAGALADDPEEAWGNAAIAGFGIGRPVRAPELDPAADRPALAPAEAIAENDRKFAIAPESLVLASAPGVPLLIAHGIPGVAVERHQDRFVVGLLGAVLAIGSAMAFALMLGGGFGT